MQVGHVCAKKVLLGRRRHFYALALLYLKGLSWFLTFYTTWDYQVQCYLLMQGLVQFLVLCPLD